jgi:hypothetical protein
MNKSKKSLLLLTPLIIAVGLFVGISVVSAQSPEVFVQELEILKDPNRDDVYTYVFNICIDEAGDGMDSVRDPTIIITSDKDTRRLQLERVFLANECVGGVEKIRADDPNSIKAKILTYGNQDKIFEMEQRIEELKRKAEQENKELKVIMSTNYPKHQDYIDAMKEQTDKLWLTRKQLQTTTEQYYQMMRYIHPESLEEDLKDFQSLSCPGSRVAVLDQYGSPYCKAVAP